MRYEGQVKQRQQRELAESVIAKIEKELENPRVLKQILDQSVADVESRWLPYDDTLDTDNVQGSFRKRHKRPENVSLSSQLGSAPCYINLCNSQSGPIEYPQSQFHFVRSMIFITCALSFQLSRLRVSHSKSSGLPGPQRSTRFLFAPNNTQASLILPVRIKLLAEPRTYGVFLLHALLHLEQDNTVWPRPSIFRGASVTIAPQPREVLHTRFLSCQLLR